MTSPTRKPEATAPLQAHAGVAPFITMDGSEIRELMHPAVHGPTLRVRNQSLAEATVRAGSNTALHRHRHTEELYHVTAGYGFMHLGNDRFVIRVGDTVCIPPGAAHYVEALGEEPLKFLCCCSPPYSRDDTELLEDAGES